MANISEEDAKALDEALAAKASLETELEKVEKQIYDLEGAYLEETARYGNVLRGWDNVPKSKEASNDDEDAADVEDVDHAVRREERLFSLSSVTSPAFRADASAAAAAPQKAGAK